MPPLPSSDHGFCTSSSVLSSILSPFHYTVTLDGVGEARYICYQSLDLET